MKRRDLWIICGVLAAALGLALLGLALRGEGDEVRVYLDGALYATLPLDEDTTLTIAQSGGEVNIIEVAGGCVRMQHANCPTRTCVACGWRCPDDARLLPDAAWIVCLPNRVSIEVAAK